MQVPPPTRTKPMIADRPARENYAVRSAFTLVELLVVIAILAVLVALLLPALGNARESAKRAQCLNLCKQMGIAMWTYCDDNEGIPPTGDWNVDRWYRQIERNLDASHRVFFCPNGEDNSQTAWDVFSDGTKYSMHYAYNSSVNNNTGQSWGWPTIKRLSDCKHPSDTPLVQEVDHQDIFWWGAFDGIPPVEFHVLSTRHGGGGNILWMDGHASWEQYNDYMVEMPAAAGGGGNFVTGNY